MVWPCGDIMYQDQQQSTEQRNHNHHNDSEEPCSPFCQCQCCHVNMVMDQTFFSVLLAEVATEYHSFYSDMLPDTPFISTFRPPKV